MILSGKNHPSIISIKKYFFNFSVVYEKVSEAEILKETKNLDSCKATQESDISTKIVKL